MNFGSLLYNLDCNNELILIIKAILKSSIEIEDLVSRVSLDNNTGSMDECIQNSSGDEQKKLDVLSNEIMIANLTSSNSCSVLLSEENDHAIIVDEEHSGNYIVAFDPLEFYEMGMIFCALDIYYMVVLPSL